MTQVMIISVSKQYSENEPNKFVIRKTVKSHYADWGEKEGLSLEWWKSVRLFETLFIFT